MSAQIGGETDWSVTFRLGALTGVTDGRLFVSVGTADDSVGVALLLDTAGGIELGRWVGTSYTAAATATTTLARDGTGWGQLVSRGGVVSARFGDGTSSDPPAVWKQVGGTVAVARLSASRLSLFLAMWAGTGITAAIDDVRVREGA